MALSLWRCGCNCNGTLLITASRLLSIDGAAASIGGQHESNDCSPCCSASCYPLKLETDSGWLSGMSAISSIVSSTVGGGGRIWQYNILLWWWYSCGLFYVINKGYNVMEVLFN